MARKRFKPERMVAILREAERGADREALFRQPGICEQPFYRWKRMYGGLGMSYVPRIEALEEENRQLKQLAGEQALVTRATVSRLNSAVYGLNAAAVIVHLLPLLSLRLFEVFLVTKPLQVQVRNFPSQEVV